MFNINTQIMVTALYSESPRLIQILQILSFISFKVSNGRFFRNN